jgi:1,4-alpha-glucan branching enzyme
MRRLVPSGVWELFVPDLPVGATYKYEVRTAEGHLIEKSDPYGFAAELRPKTASIVWDISQFAWGDQEWLDKRGERQGLEKPLAIYEVHLGSWKREDRA